jgi:predicted regulator of Ras-like GTPase activity (Roadblock/LC7/MglB family)
MQSIIEAISALNGVRHVSLYHQNELQATTFEPSQQAAMDATGILFRQIFNALEAVKKTHNEIYCSIDSGYLAAFRLHGHYVAVLLTEKKINFPLINMGLKSASESLRQQDEALEAERLLELRAARTIPEHDVPVSIDAELQPVFDAYTQILMNISGPAASVVVDDAVEQWTKTYRQTPENLTFLITIIQEALESDQDRQQFAAEAAGVPLPAM